ncbi:MAG: AMP-binding protein [Myxococcales bacterium]|nr:AMP-binding protein [Myxococcales bacterium]MDH3843723.1 AMP-binding protein [Myxococcales bacterium]
MRELSVLHAAREHPTRDCLVVEGRVWSYAEVADRVRQAIAILRHRRLRVGDRVALSPSVDLDSIIWLFALFELGCPVVLLHPRLTDGERGTILDETHPVYVIDEPVPRDAVVEVSDLEPVPPERCLAVVYTSGTRGAPRGAILSRRAFVASHDAHAANLGWTPNDRWLLSMPPAHVGGLSILTRSLIARRCVVLSPGPFDAAQVIEALDVHEVTLLSVVPTMLRRLAAFDEPLWKPAAALRAVLVGGASFPETLRREAHDRGIPVLGTYGCTEACSQVTTQRPDQAGQPGSGAPLKGVKLRIDDGEIQVSGPMLMDGYVGKDDDDSTWTADRWLRTGDAGELRADGQLVVKGRIDDMIVTGGENVAPREVEAILESTAGVTAACVFSLPHDEWGEEVVAGIVVDQSAFDRAALGQRLAAALASYKRPKRIRILSSLPLDRSGKIDRSRVKELCQDALKPI